jgi:hypothetical protein
MPSVFAYAQLNARIMPMDRGERFEDPLIEALEGTDFGQVTGGGTLGGGRSGEIEYCGIDIDLTDIDKGVPFVCKVLTKCGAPKGSKLLYEVKKKKLEVPFGKAEGLAVYLNGADLPAKVYKECDVNEVYAEINRLLGKEGAIQGHWQGPTETALYLYGKSADAMRKKIAGFMKKYPLCQKARVVTIA